LQPRGYAVSWYPLFSRPTRHSSEFRKTHTRIVFGVKSFHVAIAVVERPPSVCSSETLSAAANAAILRRSESARNPARDLHGRSPLKSLPVGARIRATARRRAASAPGSSFQAVPPKVGILRVGLVPRNLPGPMPRFRQLWKTRTAAHNTCE